MTKHHKANLIAGFSISALALSALVLSSPSSSADTTQTITLNLNVASVCTLSVNTASHTATIDPGTAGQLGSSTLTAICNDNDGLAVYAVGFSGDSLGNNTLISTTNSSNTIPSATASSPTTSQWNMTLAAVSGDYAPTITNQTTGDNPVGDFTNPHIIPTVYTKVAYRNSYTDAGTNATGASFTASFNAYVGATQTAGTYQGKVKFLLVHPNITDSSTNPVTTAPDTFLTLQSVANWGSSVALGDTVEAMDERDGQMYQVKRLKMNAAGTETALWMTQNLAITGNIPAEGSNFSSPSTFNVSQYDLSDSTNCTGSGASESDPKGYSNVCSKTGTDNEGNPTAWYNFAAASAGSITGYSNSNATTGDICPSGWHLPTNAEQSSLVHALGSDYTPFHPVYDGGFYYNGSLVLASSYWWSATVYDDYYRYYLNYDGGNMYADGSYRYVGFYVRCVRTS